MNNNNQMNNNQGQRRPLTDEERRKIAAAQAAGMRMNNNGRVNPNQTAQPGVRRQNPTPPGYNGSRNPNNPNYNRQNMHRNTPQNSIPRKRRRRKVRINAGIVIFAVLMVSVLGVSLGVISKKSGNEVKDYTINRIEVPEEAMTPTGGDSDDSSTASQTSPESENNENPSSGEVESYTTTLIENSQVDVGELVLVNYNYPFARIDEITLKNAYSERQSKIKVSSTTLGMTPTAFNALESLVNGLVEDTGCDDLLIYSGHRTLADQQRIWDSNMEQSGEEYTKTYVAVPGYSEHHTGLACDLGFYTDDGASVPLADHEFGGWVGEHCTEYGYILRYPADKADITKIGHEQWHFRYVGLAHAYATKALGMCLEEYIDYIRTYTYDTKLLHIGSDRNLTDVTANDVSSLNDGWIVYFVKLSDGDTTEIKLPAGVSDGMYKISGNNSDGFIITVKLGNL